MPTPPPLSSSLSVSVSLVSSMSSSRSLTPSPLGGRHPLHRRAEPFTPRRNILFKPKVFPSHRGQGGVGKIVTETASRRGRSKPGREGGEREKEEERG